MIADLREAESQLKIFLTRIDAAMPRLKDLADGVEGEAVIGDLAERRKKCEAELPSLTAHNEKFASSGDAEMRSDLRDVAWALRDLIDGVFDALPALRDNAETPEGRALIADINTEVQQANRAFGMIRFQNESIRHSEQRGTAS